MLYWNMLGTKLIAHWVEVSYNDQEVLSLIPTCTDLFHEKLERCKITKKRENNVARLL